MKQIQIGQFDLGRLLSYLLSGLAILHSAEDESNSSEDDSKSAQTILKAAERRWPSRYY